MCKKVITGAFLGGLVLFVWQFAIHMLLGIYDEAFVKLKDSAAVEAVLKANIEGSGMIMVPYADETDEVEMAKATEQLTTGFSLFGPATLNGRHGFGLQLGIQFVLNMLASAVLMFVMLAAQPRTLGTRLALALCFAVFVVLVGVLPNWNWWGYSLAYIGGQIGELIVGWALVGLVLAKVMGGSSLSDD